MEVCQIVENDVYLLLKKVYSQELVLASFSVVNMRIAITWLTPYSLVQTSFLVVGNHFRLHTSLFESAILFLNPVFNSRHRLK